MRGAMKAALSLSIGSSALILSGMAFGQATGIGSINFGSQSMTGCTLGDAGTCKVLASGNGFVQRQFASGGKTYIQTQIDDSAGFKSEDFVRLGSGSTSEPGISSKLDITAPTTATGDTFGTGSTIKSGWAAANANLTEATINLAVGRTGTTNKADDFQSNFLVSTTYDKTTSANAISNLRVDQVAYLGSADQKQVFATQIMAAKSAATNMAFATGTTSWSTGNMIQATYVGQAVNVGTATAPSLAYFGSETATNLGTGTSTFASNLVSATPTYWTTTGPTPMQSITPFPTF